MYRLIGKIIAGITFAPIVFGFFVVGFALAFSCNESGTISRCSNPDVVAPLAFLVFWTNRIGMLALGYGVICLLAWFLIGALKRLNMESNEGVSVFNAKSMVLIILVILMAADTLTVWSSATMLFSTAKSLAIYVGPLVIVAMALLRKDKVLPVISAGIAIVVGSFIEYGYHSSHDHSKGMLMLISLLVYWLCGFVSLISLTSKNPNPAVKRDAAKARRPLPLR